MKRAVADDTLVKYKAEYQPPPNTNCESTVLPMVMVPVASISTPVRPATAWPTVRAPAPAFKVTLLPLLVMPALTATATPLAEEDVLAIAKREGWHAAKCDRGECFHVIEIWVENRFLLEVLTQEMQAEYQAFMKPAVFAKTFGFPQAA